MILCDPYLLLLQGCVGALDGTHIPVHVPAHARGRYRNKKGDLTTNVLGVCSPDAEHNKLAHDCCFVSFRQGFQMGIAMSIFGSQDFWFCLHS